MGTPAYMAPEQTTAPATVDHRADIYALGVVLYQMLTGELPTPAQTLIPPSRKIHIDVRLDEIVLRALEQNPARRYDQASDLKTHVELLTQASTSPPPPPPLPTADNPHDHPTHTTTPPQSRIPRHPLIAPFIAILISTVVFLAILIWASGQLPERVASHFNFSGRADGWLSRTTFLLLLEFSGLGTSFVMGALFLAIHHVSLRFVNLPFISPGNRRYWMAPERLSATLAFVRVRGLWIIPGLLGFFAALVVIIVYANRLTPPRLPLYWLAAPTLLLLGTMFFAFTLPFITRKTRGLPLPAPHRPFPPPLSFVLILAGLLLPTLASLWLTQEKSPGFIHPQTAALIATHNDTVRDAQTWLALIDDGHYKQSRDEAASVFRSKVNLESWTLALQQHRQPLGAVVNRRIFSAENENPNTKTPLLVMQFATEFSRKKSAIETVTFSREPDGVWRASGYYIK
ncbi:DUF4019 domain-containing protein [Opitutaceae bacterium TAV4]|nr:DUF4019 domain-containing protein [Opitutaceae bacterium TAV4]